MASVEKWVWLSCALRYGTRKAFILYDAFKSIDGLFSAAAEEYKKICPSLRESELCALSDKSLAKAEGIIRDCVNKNIRIITPESDEYPNRLKNIFTPPTVLYARGMKLSLDSEAAVAIVGTRKSSQYGEDAARKIAGEIAEGGGVVVSGLASGIDAIALSSAVDSGGKTVAVLGNGVDICFPYSNEKLMKQIIETGTVISEYPPGMRPTRFTFPQRNRIISGISVGTVVVEAPKKSGALITANFCIEQDRDLYVVPSGIFTEQGEGTNNLILQGATPISSGGDVLSEYMHMFPGKIKLSDIGNKKKAPQKKNPEVPEQSENSRAPVDLSNFSEEERKVLMSITDSGLCADDIAERCQLTAQETLILLTLLEIKGAVKALPGNKFKSELRN